ncbi:MAG: leucyl aminopeptidase family protein [Azospirillaceae bacterium]
MRDAFVETAAGAESGAIPLHPVDKAGLEAWLGARPPAETAWLRAAGFKAEPGRLAPIPAAEGGGRIAGVAVGVAAKPDLWALAGAAKSLPPGDYRLEDADGRLDPAAAALGWALGTYAFRRYRTGMGKPAGNGETAEETDADKPRARLAWPEGVDGEAVLNAAEATALCRDLITTPANDMGPAELAAEVERLAGAHGAACTVIEGDALLEAGYPAIHAVGRASARAPRLVDLTWGDPGAPKLTLVGKGVCFDTGGLDLKPSSGMLLMKKDMGGAAHALALARMVMTAGLPVRLRLLIPAVENAVSGDAFRPLDVLTTRKGLTVEVGNTDAEGRLILADALTEADGESPDLVVDFATLTGAARVALGPDLPALFANDDAVAEALIEAGGRVGDPLWRLPLHDAYDRMLESSVADVSSTGSGPFAGAITAALFLRRFVSEKTPWVHIDQMAWNSADRPGRPKGGEAMGLRAVFAMIAARYGA